MTLVIEADGIFQGGGVRGLALAGALLGFADHERVTVRRWVGMAGTSVGAMIAAYMATGHGPDELEDALCRMPSDKFTDWGPGGKLAGGAWNLARHHGLARGEYFRQWLDERLEGATFASVRNEENVTDKTGDPYRLRLVAADITQRRLLVLPADLARYRMPGTDQPINVDEFKIADAVRMSMSIPFFFQPVELESENGEVCTIVDGSIISNFPVWLFDRDRPVDRPTFGFQLVGAPPSAALDRLLDAFGWPARLAVDMFHTAVTAWDTRFMSASTIVRTCPVPVGHIAGATEFSLSTRQRQALVDTGRAAAKRFLDDFRIEAYVNTFGQRFEVAQEGARDVGLDRSAQPSPAGADPGRAAQLRFDQARDERPAPELPDPGSVRRAR
jgi:NTE family protein